MIRDFYKRLTAKGKLFKVALVACMRKLLTILNSMIKHKTRWSETFLFTPLDFEDSCYEVVSNWPQPLHNDAWSWGLVPAYGPRPRTASLSFSAASWRS